jgi:hypothetical protein
LDLSATKQTQNVGGNLAGQKREMNLIIPDKIEISFYDKSDRPIRQDKILIGIKTYATGKNDIELSPFLTDDSGTIILTKTDILKSAENFISYGIMDYNSIHSARQNIDFFLWGTENIKEYLNYWRTILNNKRDLKNFELWGDTLGKRDKESALIEKREREVVDLFETCFNRTTKFKSNMTIFQDNWDGRENEKKYRITLDF